MEQVSTDRAEFYMKVAELSCWALATIIENV
jgi:hypothetical protein